MNSILRALAPVALGSLATLAAAGCTLNDATPGLPSGPSEFALSIAATATPEVLAHDGASQSTIVVVARDEVGRPVPNLPIHWQATSSSPRATPVRMSATLTVTDANGRTSIVVTAPPAPTEIPAVPDTITIDVTPRPTDASFASFAPRRVLLRLLPPNGLQFRNNDPVPAFSASPGLGVFEQPITFNASATTDENEPCLSRCTYRWDFGDGETAIGMIVAHRYVRPESGAPTSTDDYSVNLTVIDERGGVGSLVQEVSVRPSFIPTARFTNNPEAPTEDNGATFNASASTAAPGYVITNYSWSFGDGTPVVNTANSVVEHTFNQSGVFAVRLTVTDNGGRSDESVKIVTVDEAD